RIAGQPPIARGVHRRRGARGHGRRGPRPRPSRPRPHAAPADTGGMTMPKIAFIGAGSTVFTRNLVGDVLGLPELADTTTFALMDTDAERLRTSESVARGPGA